MGDSSSVLNGSRTGFGRTFPQGLKPELSNLLYAALKRRSFTLLPGRFFTAGISESNACENI
jgi:hypothetical protein